MSDKVIPFGKPEEKYCTAAAICIECAHEWQAVTPSDAKWLECPNCRAMKGHWKFEYFPSDRTIYNCGCGNSLFYITLDGWMCPNCGYEEKVK